MREEGGFAYRNQSVSKVEGAVHPEDMNAEILSPGDLACPQIQPVVDYGKRCLLDVLLDASDHHLRQSRSSQIKIRR